MGERTFEPAHLGSDPWGMGFDVDLALDTHATRKNNMGLTSVGSTSSPIGNASISIGYNDVHHMLLHRFEDDLNEGEITEISPLSNSLPKGDPETAQSFLAKIASGCHDLTREFGGNQGTSQKGIEASLFGPVNDGNAASATGVLLTKPPAPPVDVYGRVSLYEGKLVLQLRHFNVNTNYPVNVSECWLCREKMSNGSQIHSHKHVLQGLFQVNEEFVQMDIDHYIIPEQALEPDPSEVNRSLSTSNIMSGSSSSSITHHVAENRTLTLGDDIECSDALQNSHVTLNAIGGGLHTPQRNIDTNNESLQTPKGGSEMQYAEADLSSAFSTQQPLNSNVTMDSSSFLNTLSNTELRIPSGAPSIVQTSNQPLINHVTNTPSQTNTFQPSNLGLSNCSIPSNSTIVSSEESIITSHDAAGNHSSLDNIQDLCSSSGSISRNDGFIQHTTYEPNISNKEQLDNYQTFFGSQYPYSYGSSNLGSNLSKYPVDSHPPAAPLYPPTSNSVSPAGKSVDISKKNEVGAKKRKCRTQKKPSSIKLKETEGKTLSVLSKNGNKNSLQGASEKDQPEESSDKTGPSLSNSESGVENVSSSLDKLQSGASKVSSTSDISGTKEFFIICPCCKIQYSLNDLVGFKAHTKEHQMNSFASFSCPVCNKEFSGIERYIRHLKVHSGKRHFCPFCDSHYSRPDQLRKHIANIHNGKKPFACDVCSKSFSRADYLNSRQNTQALCLICSSSNRNDGFIQHTTYEPNIGHKEQLDNYENFFGSQYPYSYDASSLNNQVSKYPGDSQSLTGTAESHPTTSISSVDKIPCTTKVAEAGPQKRRTQKKTNNFKTKENDQSISSNFSNKVVETSSSTNEGGQETGSDYVPSGETYSFQTKLGTVTENSTSLHSKSQSQTTNVSSSSDLSDVGFYFECPVCKSQFSNKDLPTFKSHLKLHLGLDSFTTFYCPVCHKTVSGAEEFVKHLKVHSEKRYFCSLCDSHYSRPDKLRRHIANIHDSKKPFVCDICSKAFSRVDYLMSHKNIHLGKKFECDICQKFFSSQFNLKVHKQSHSTDKLPFACDICDKSYQRKDFLATHVAKDHKNRRFKCDVCAKLFSRNDVLKRHKAVHDEKRVTYDCKDCGKQFQRKDRLKAHSYDHLKTKNDESKPDGNQGKRKSFFPKYQCHKCSKYMPSNLRLEKHLRWHETRANFKVKLETNCIKSFKCLECSKMFKTKELLQRHVLRVHDQEAVSQAKISNVSESDDRKKVPKFLCEICSKSFTRSYNLKMHMKTHIKKGTEDDKMLAELPTVLSASKSNDLKRRRKKSYFNLMKDAASKTYSAIEIITSASCSGDLSLGEGLSKDEDPSSSVSDLNIPLEEGFVPSSSTSSYNPHFSSPLSSEIPIPPSSSSSFCNINPSSEVISAAAYLLAHPFYEGPYP